MSDTAGRSLSSWLQRHLLRAVTVWYAVFAAGCVETAAYADVMVVAGVRVAARSGRRGRTFEMEVGLKSCRGRSSINNRSQKCT